MLDSTSAARTAQIRLERGARHCQTAGSAKNQPKFV
jgi:hypothetical protein